MMCWTDLSCSFLFSGRTWGPSPSGQSSMNCSQCESCPLAAALQELLQHESFSMGCCLSGTGCFIVGPAQGHSPLYPSPYYSVVSSMGCRWISAPPCSAGSQLPHPGLHPRLKGSLSSHAWSISCLSFLTLGSVEIFFLHGLPPFSG